MKKSTAAVNLNGILWEISAAGIRNGVVPPKLPKLLEEWANAACAADPIALCRGELL